MKRLLWVVFAISGVSAVLAVFFMWRDDRQIEGVADIAHRLEDDGADVTIGQRGPFGGSTPAWLPWNQRIIVINIDAAGINDESVAKMNEFDAIDKLTVEGQGLDATQQRSLASIGRLHRLVLRNVQLPRHEIELLSGKLPDTEIFEE